MINALHAKATVNSKGRDTKIIKVHTQSHMYPHNYKHGEGYNFYYDL